MLMLSKWIFNLQQIVSGRFFMSENYDEILKKLLFGKECNENEIETNIDGKF